MTIFTQCGNVTTTIPDHLPQFLIALDIFSNSLSTKLNSFERDWSNFYQENVILGYVSVDWKNLTKSINGNVDQSFASFLVKFNSILDMYSQTNLKIFRNKSWIDLSLQK